MSEPTPFHRFDGAAAWASLDDAQRAAIGAHALEFMLVLHLHDHYSPGRQYHLPDIIPRVAVAADGLVLPALETLVRESLPDDAFTAPDGKPRVPSLLGGICRGCGCSQNDACDEGCGWASEDWCTACDQKGGAA